MTDVSQEDPEERRRILWLPAFGDPDECCGTWKMQGVLTVPAHRYGRRAEVGHAIEECRHDFIVFCLKICTILMGRQVLGTVGETSVDEVGCAP